MSHSFPKTSASAGRYVWPEEPSCTGRNAYVLFVREFALEAEAVSAELALSADSRYVLRVNGEWVASGPPRFMPAAPRHNVWNIAPRLRRGTNRIEVVVNASHVSTFQTDPRSRGGFMAGGEVRTRAGRLSLETPGAWACKPLRAWRGDAPAFSFALGPVESCDLRLLQEELADPDGLMPAGTVEDGPWGMSCLSEVKPPDFRLVPPVEIAGPVRWPKTESLTVFGLPGARGGGLRYAVKTWVRAPRAGVFRFSSLWMHPRVNGGPVLTGEPDALLGGRTNYEAFFHEGWNFLAGYLDALTERWTVQLAFSAADGLELSAGKIHGDRHAVAVAGPLTKEQSTRLADTVADDPEAWTSPDLAWTSVESDLLEGAPARRMAWIVPESRLPGGMPWNGKSRRMRIDAGTGWMAVLDWGTSFVGHLCLDIEAPAGALLEVAWAETLRADGCARLYPGNPRIESADRFVLGGGRQCVDGFAVRGGRYAQVHVDLPDGGAGEVVLHRAAIRSVLSPLDETGDFSCDDELWNWIWRTGRATLQACMEDVYVDCPWRERGLYIADAWAAARLQRLFSADRGITRHCLRLIAEGRLADGQLNAVTPSWYQSALADFSLTWILALRDHWAWTGDVALVRELWPVVTAVLSSPAWQENELGLWDRTGAMSLFIDWGATSAAKAGRGNACLNAFRAEGLSRAAELAEAIGLRDEGQRLGAAAKRARKAFAEHLFDGRGGRFLCSLEEQEGAEGGSIHANILALAFGLGEAWQRERALGFALGEIERFARAPVGAKGPKMELFFLNYALDALHEAGEPEMADRLVRACYGPMRDRGAPTFWETLSEGSLGGGSQCHAWSGAATHACITRILGLRPAKPGRTDKYVVAPRCAGLSRAGGVFPHPKGEIRVDWTRDGDGLRVTASAPEGVELIVESEVAGEPAGGLPRS